MSIRLHFSRERGDFNSSFNTDILHNRSLFTAFEPWDDHDRHERDFKRFAVISSGDYDGGIY